MKTWRTAVRDAIDRITIMRSDGCFTRQELIHRELDTITSQAGSHGATPGQTLSRILQDLRRDGEVEFIGNGRYRLIKQPVIYIDIETQDYDQYEVDTAIKEKRLRIGVVDTDTPIAVARRRKGQDRLRILTLENYSVQCALCDIKDPQLLVTSHIIPWAEKKETRGHLDNCICLCRFHDILFEYGYWSLTLKNTIEIKINSSSYILRSLFSPRFQFRFPHSYPPDSECIKWHRNRHGYS